MSPSTIPKLAIAFLAFCILDSALSVAVANAVAAAPDALYISAVLLLKLSACSPARASTAVWASTELNSFANASSSPPTLCLKASSAPCNPLLSKRALPFAYPSFSSDAVISLEGDKKPCMVAFSCVVTSAVLPVTPVSVAIAPNKSSCFRLNVAARGITLPTDDASSGNDVCPNLTV